MVINEKMTMVAETVTHNAVGKLVCHISAWEIRTQFSGPTTATINTIQKIVSGLWLRRIARSDGDNRENIAERLRSMLLDIKFRNLKL
jgi:hypothetical protein